MKGSVAVSAEELMAAGDETTRDEDLSSCRSQGIWLLGFLDLPLPHVQSRQDGSVEIRCGTSPFLCPSPHLTKSPLCRSNKEPRHHSKRYWRIG
jgi:hypothetical protein